MIRNWWYGNANCKNPRLDPIADALSSMSDEIFFIGGYVRGTFHEDKVASDLDVVVPDKVFGVAERILTQQFQCKKQSAYRSDYYDTWRIRPEGYEVYNCPKGVSVDLFTKTSFDENSPTISSDIHHLTLGANSVYKSSNERKFPTNALIEKMKQRAFQCQHIESQACDKLIQEGWTEKI